MQTHTVFLLPLAIARECFRLEIRDDSHPREIMRAHTAGELKGNSKEAPYSCRHVDVISTDLVVKLAIAKYGGSTGQLQLVRSLLQTYMSNQAIPFPETRQSIRLRSGA